MKKYNKTNISYDEFRLENSNKVFDYNLSSPIKNDTPENDNKETYQRMWQEIVINGGDGQETYQQALKCGISKLKIDDIIKEIKTEIDSSNSYELKGDPYSYKMLSCAFDKLSINWHYDDVMQSTVVNIKNNGYQKITDTLSHHIIELIAENCYYIINNKKIPYRIDMKSFNAHKATHDYRKKGNICEQWLKSLPAPKKPKSFLETYMKSWGVEDTPINRYAQKAIFCGIVQRILNPGCMIRAYPVLVGDRETGKTTFVSNLLPPELPSDFTEHRFNAGADHKSMVDLCMGTIVVEMSEMENVKGKGWTTLKAFLTEKEYGDRLCYDKYKSQIKATTMFIGTSNHCDFLPNDHAAACRFLPIEWQRGVDPAVWVPENRNELFALAYQAVKDDPKFLSYIPENITEKLKETVDKYMEIDDFKNELIVKIMNKLNPEIRARGFTASEFDLLCSQVLPSKSEPVKWQSMAAYLRETGWRKRKSNGAYYWIPPKDLCNSLPYEWGGTMWIHTKESSVSE